MGNITPLIPEQKDLEGITEIQADILSQEEKGQISVPGIQQKYQIMQQKNGD